MNNELFRKLGPHVAAYFIMMAIAFAFYAPAVFEGKVLTQSDNIQAKGGQAEMLKVREETGKFPLWTNSMFAGMPSYQIQFGMNKNLIKYPLRVMLLFQSMLKPHIATLLIMFGIYLLLIVLRVDWRIGLLGAVALGLSTNHVLLMEAGHSVKLIAIAFVAPIIAGVVLAFRGRYILGGGLTALFLAMELMANHVQVTYYLFLTLLVLGIIYLVKAIRENTLPHFTKAAGVLLLAGLLALGSNISRLWTTYEYSQETIRGKSELTNKSASSGSNSSGNGLSKDYAFDWSYGVLETYNLLIPNFMGGSSTEVFVQDRNSPTYRALTQLGQEANNYVRATAHYWGPQPFTSGPVYLGAIIIFLFFLGAFLYRDPLKVWLLIATVLTIFLAWGEHFSAFNYFLFDNLPLFNKFRAVTIALTVTNVLVVILAALGLQSFFAKEISKEQKLKALYLAGGISGGLVLLGLLLSGSLDYGVAGQNLPDNLAAALQEDRAGLLRADAWRSLGFIAVAFAILWAWLRMRFSSLLAVGALLVFVLIDNWNMGRRSIDADAFVAPRALEQNVAPREVDKQIQKDPDLHFRVVDLDSNPFSNAITSYHHKSMGGYHAAKLMRYQELIERYLSNPNNSLHIYGMLNCKYLIQNQQPQYNSEVLGNAWFVRDYEVVPDGDAEINGLADLRPGEKALVQKKYEDYLAGFNLQYDSTASIRLTSYHPDKMVYEYSAASEQLAVFSEVYYPPSKGWKVRLDGEEVAPFVKADFLLRALRLPPGQNRKVEMIFEPRSYYLGENISLIASLLTLALAGFGLWYFFSKQSIPQAANLPEPEKVKSPTTKVKRTVATKAKKKSRSEGSKSRKKNKK